MIKNHPMRSIKGTPQAKQLMDEVRSHKAPMEKLEQQRADEISVANRYIEKRSA